MLAAPNLIGLLMLNPSGIVFLSFGLEGSCLFYS